MPGAARVLVDTVVAGVITGPGVPSVVINGAPASVVGDTVAAHGEPPHTTPTIATGSTTVIIGGKFATVQDISVASCQHKVSAGSLNVIIGK
jgi:uncharacterized Zn-binding protein involved in type VI secretion